MQSRVETLEKGMYCLRSAFSRSEDVRDSYKSGRRAAVDVEGVDDAPEDRRPGRGAACRRPTAGFLAVAVKL